MKEEAGKAIQKAKNGAAVAALQVFAEQSEEYFQTLAKLRRDSFKAHIAAGFTEAQALELCAKITV